MTGRVTGLPWVYDDGGRAGPAASNGYWQPPQESFSRWVDTVRDVVVSCGGERHANPHDQRRAP